MTADTASPVAEIQKQMETANLLHGLALQLIIFVELAAVASKAVPAFKGGVCVLLHPVFRDVGMGFVNQNRHVTLQFRGKIFLCNNLHGFSQIEIF